MTPFDIPAPPPHSIVRYTTHAPHWRTRLALAAVDARERAVDSVCWALRIMGDATGVALMLACAVGGCALVWMVENWSL